MSYICDCCGEGLPEDTPCPCTFDGEPEYDCRHCREPWAYEEGGLCSECSDTLRAAAEKRAATRKANQEATIAKTRAAIEAIPADAHVVYPIIPKDRYDDKSCRKAVQAIRERYPDALVIDTPNKFGCGRDWLENWPHLLPRVKTLVVCPREYGSIGLGGYQELASASTFRMTLNNFKSLPPVLCGDRHFPNVEVLVFRKGRFYRLDIARTLYSRKECGRIGASLGRRASPWERSKRQWFAEVVAGDKAI